MELKVRIGEERYNEYGEKMTIVEYKNARNIIIEFDDKFKTRIKSQYINFKNGSIKNPNRKTIYNEGYYGVGNYVAFKNGKHTHYYMIWRHMMRRCYDDKYHKKQWFYKGCKVCDEWLNFQNFAKWYEENYYEVEEQRMHLDKDILYKGNKLYSPDTCVFVPQEINEIFTTRKNDRGNYYIGVRISENGRFQARCNMYGQSIHLGIYDSEVEAFNVYKNAKEKYIKEVANHYKLQIPKKLYDAMYKYKVEITD